MTDNNDFNNIENDSTNSRNEKRFKLFVGENYGVQKIDGEVIFDSIISMAEADVLVDLLNDLTEENEQLKKVIAENEKLIQSTYDELTKLRCFKKNILRIKHSWDYLMEAIQYD